MEVWLEVGLIGLGILLNGFFAGSEIAIVSARSGRLAALRDQGRRGATVALALKDNTDTFLATIQIAITAVGTLASAVGGATAAEALTPALADLGLGAWARPVALVSVVIAITYASLVVGELAPKSIALRDPERTAVAVAPIIAAVSRLSSAPVRLLTASTNVILRAFGFGRSAGPPLVSEEDVRYLVREGAARGVFEKVEEQLVHSAFEFADTTVREIMTPRLRVRAIDVATPPGEIVARAVAIGHTRIPVHEGSAERTIGILTLKDLLRSVAAGDPRAVRDLMRPPLFVPEGARISAMLRELQRTRQGLAVVVDEYGAELGLVTVEDVVEEIVGDIGDETTADASGLVTRLPDGSLVVDGLAPIPDVERAVGATLPAREPGGYTTIAGFILATLNDIPVRGTSLVAAGHRWTVTEMDGPRIRRVTVRSV